MVGNGYLRDSKPFMDPDAAKAYGEKKYPTSDYTIDVKLIGKKYYVVYKRK